MFRRRHKWHEFIIPRGSHFRPGGGHYRRCLRCGFEQKYVQVVCKRRGPVRRVVKYEWVPEASRCGCPGKPKQSHIGIAF